MSEASERMHEIRNEITDLLREARNLAKECYPSMLPNWDAYVFEQIKEHLNKGNPYNTDLNDIANALESIDDDIDEEDLEEEEEEQ